MVCAPFRRTQFIALVPGTSKQILRVPAKIVDSGCPTAKMTNRGSFYRPDRTGCLAVHLTVLRRRLSQAGKAIRAGTQALRRSRLEAVPTRRADRKQPVLVRSRHPSAPGCHRSCDRGGHTDDPHVSIEHGLSGLDRQVLNAAKLMRAHDRDESALRVGQVSCRAVRSRPRFNRRHGNL